MTIIASFDIGSLNFAWCVLNTETNTIISHKNSDITKPDDSVLINMYELLNSYIDLWSQCSVFLIEQQMRTNYKALLLAQHLHSYLIFRFGKLKSITMFPSTNKTRLMNAPKKMTKIQRKKWAVMKANELMLGNGSGQLPSVGKCDDLADAYLMCQAYIKMKN